LGRLVKIGLMGLAFTLLITIIAVLAGGQVAYTAPIAIPFSVMILIGLSNRKRRE
jgi:hypothetical protein